MGRKNPLVSIILVTYNGQAYIEDCLESVFKQDYDNLEVLVIDNHSHDETRRFLDKIKAQRTRANEFDSVWNRFDLKVIYNDENMGFAAGHNKGIRESHGEFICCLNQDAVLDKNFIKETLSPFFENKKTATVQGKVYRLPKKEISVIDTVGLLMLKNRRVVNLGQGQEDQGQFETSKEVFGADGACPVYRRSALKKIKIDGQYFDEDFFCYKEDVDLAWRLRLAGWRAFYWPHAYAWHWRGSGDSLARNLVSIIKERKKINQFSKFFSFRNQRLMQIKNEIPWLFFKHSFWILPKEIVAWLYVLIFEKYTRSALISIFKDFSKTWQKRKKAMKKRKVSTKEIAQWFK